MINTNKTPNTLDRTDLAFVPETGKKEYVIVCHSKEDWESIHELLMQDGTLEDNIPSHSCECINDLRHSDTRGIYLLDDEEVEQIKNHPKVYFCEIHRAAYPGSFAPDPADLQLDVQRTPRFGKNVLNYRAYNTAPSTPPTTRVSLGSSDMNRTGYQLLRHTQKENPWDATGAEYDLADRTGADHRILERDIYQLGDGTGVDAIVADEGFWIGHPEFVHCPGTDPVGYQTGNVLTWSGISSTPGTCGVLDLVLDAPYYIDPDFFNADPANRLVVRWDGTTVPVESAARSWWSDSAQRSVGFSTIGTVTGISTAYTRPYCNGSNAARPTNNTNHGTECAGLVFGKNHGVAYNCNRWVLNLYGNGSAGIEGPGFDVQKLFHLYKPNYDRHSANNGNQQRTDGKNPTLSSNSWGYRSTSYAGSYYYHYRPSAIDGTSAGVSYAGGQPAFFLNVGDEGDSGRLKGEMVDNSATTAGAEMVNAGVIFVAAAGNSGQTQMNPGDLDYNNYWTTAPNISLQGSTHLEFGLSCYNTFNRRGWPQHIGKTTAGLSTEGTEFPAINIGALDDQISFNARGLATPTINNTEYKECIVAYSDRGTAIDCYAAADDTLSPEGAAGGTWQSPETYPGLSVTAYDEDFSGTSAACPVAAGWITTKLQYNRGWEWRDIKSWLRNQCGRQDPARFYYGPAVTSHSATDNNWRDVHSINTYGEGPVVIWDAPTGSPTEPQKPRLTFGLE